MSRFDHVTGNRAQSNGFRLDWIHSFVFILDFSLDLLLH